MKKKYFILFLSLIFIFFQNCGSTLDSTRAISHDKNINSVTKELINDDSIEVTKEPSLQDNNKFIEVDEGSSPSEKNDNDIEYIAQHISVIPQVDTAIAKVTLTEQGPLQFITWPKNQPENMTAHQCEPSDRYDEHNKNSNFNIKGLEAEQSYYIQAYTHLDPISLDYSACSSFNWFPIGEPVLFTTLKESTSLVTADSREEFWLNQGFKKIWSSTPKSSDIDHPIENYLNSHSFTNGIPIIRLKTRSDVLPKVVHFDGAPAIRIESTPTDEDEQLAVKGHQLKNVDFNEVVFSMEVYNPSEYPLDGIRSGGRYQGRGVYWGAPKGQTLSPGGSNNRPDSWSVRSPYGANKIGGTLENKDWLYVYPARQFSNPNSGDVRGHVAGAPDKKVDVWQRSEIHVLQNIPSSSNNGHIQALVDGVLSSEWKGRLRWRDDVYPRGFGFFFQLKNTKTQVVYIRDFKIFVR